MSFRIVEHAGEAIVEVIYPAQPTRAQVELYATEIRGAILRQAGPWSCLVDQRALHVMAPELVGLIGDLNRWAQLHGMRRAARVVASSVASLQSTRMAREASVAVPVRTFDDRDAALAWLRSK